MTSTDAGARPDPVFAETAPAARRLAENSAVDGASLAIGELPATRDGLWARIGSRIWVIALDAAIIVSLCAIYGVPWFAGLVAIACFVTGTAFIPRRGLPESTRPMIIAADEGPNQHAFAKLFVDAIPEPAVVLAADGAILSFNPKAEDLFEGLKPGGHISGSIRNPQVLDAVGKSSEGNRLQTVPFTDRVPVERHMAASVSFFGPAQRLKDPAILLFMRDLTEQHRLDQLRSDFIANASHEIKTPLASLAGFIETLQGAARHDPAAHDRFLDIMAKQAERMRRLIDNLMSLSRVEMRAHLKPQDRVQIGDLVAQACDALEPMAAEANIKVEVRSSVSNVKVLGDRDELMQVFINLIHNAIKYGSPGGEVTATIERLANEAPSKIAISIDDNGPGIARQHLPRLTERFYRAANSPAFEKGGTGLGLAIVKHVVNRHRGELQINSEEGVGSRFTVVLTETGP